MNIKIFGLTVLGMILFLSCEKKDETTDGTGKSVDLSRDLACYYNFDLEEASDISGKGNVGVISHGAKFTTDTPNGRGKALSLDGTSQQYINIPYRIIGDSVNYTLSIWVKDFGTGALITSISDNRYSVPSFYINSDCNFVFNVSGHNNVANQDISYLQTGVWHHLVLTAARQLEKATIFVDGRLFDTKDVSYIEARDSKMVIGGNGDGSFSAWADPMLIDNFRVYRRCLSAKEVTELYNQERQ